MAMDIRNMVRIAGAMLIALALVNTSYGNMLNDPIVHAILAPVILLPLMLMIAALVAEKYFLNHDLVFQRYFRPMAKEMFNLSMAGLIAIFFAVPGSTLFMMLAGHPPDNALFFTGLLIVVFSFDPVGGLMSDVLEAMIRWSKMEKKI